MLRVGQLRFAWSPPEWVVATSLCQSTGRYPLPHGILKAGVWFRRGRLLIVSPDSQATACLPSGRNSTYRPVQISGTGSGNRDPCDLGFTVHDATLFWNLLEHAKRKSVLVKEASTLRSQEVAELKRD